MANKTTEKFIQTKLAISDRSVRLNVPSRLSIVEAVQTINSAFKTPAERRAIAGEKAIECRHYKQVGDVLGIYLVGYIPNDEIGIVPHKTGEDLSLVGPPDDADFLDGELMALIAEDAVIVCRLGLYESALNSYIRYLGPKAGLDKEDASFFFKNRADVDKLQMIHNDGVASIRFEGVANSASVESVTETTDRGLVSAFVGRVWTDLQALTYSEMKTKRHSENLKVEVFLKYDKRTGTQIDQQEIQSVAEQVAETDGEFQIKTLSGRTINPTDVLLNKKISLKRYGKSVAFSEVFTEMLKFYKELTSIEVEDG